MDYRRTFRFLIAPVVHIGIIERNVGIIRSEARSTTASAAAAASPPIASTAATAAAASSTSAPTPTARRRRAWRVEEIVKWLLFGHVG